MLARAIVDHPRLLLIDGTLDSLPDDTISELLAHLFGQQRRWTTLIATGRQVVIDHCDGVVTLLPLASQKVADERSHVQPRQTEEEKDNIDSG